jgi:two-component system response regulator YesN
MNCAMNLYKFLLVDDDDLIREEIRDNIWWDNYGFQFIGGCPDGKQAVNAIEKNHPDVILTDICMPFLDGLELAKYVSERFPKVKVIILTGYDRFDYAQQAIKFNVNDFLLKPITPDELIKLLQKLKKELDCERSFDKDIGELRKKINESFPVLKERFLNKLINKRLDETEIQNKISYFSPGFKYENYLVIVLDIDNSDEIQLHNGEEYYGILSMKIYNICTRILHANKITAELFYNNDGYMIMILNYNPGQEIDEARIFLAENIRKSIEENCGCTVTLGIGTECKNVTDLPLSYQKSLTALEYRFQFGCNQVINYTDLNQTRSIQHAMKREWIKEIINALKTQDIAVTKDIIKKMIEDIRQSNFPIDKCYVYIQKLIVFIYTILEDLNIEEKLIFGEIKNPFEYIKQCKTIEKIEEWLSGVADKINKSITEKKFDSKLQKINLAKQFIDGQYNKDGLTLSSICRHLCMCKSKFSLIFKKYTGRTFKEYLTMVRLEKSKELLRTTNMKFYEIADFVGFKDPHYFTHIFKKIVKMTPSQFKEYTGHNNRETRS